MSKDILVLMTSPRKNGNTSRLTDAYIQGAIKKGHNIRIFYASNQIINPCVSCQYCVSHNGKCVQEDDMQGIYAAFEQADVVVLASPLYFHSISAQLKTIIDRLYAAGSYKSFEYDKKESVFLMTCMESDDSVFEQAKAYYHTLLAKAFPWDNKGEIYVNGLTEKRDSIEGHSSLEAAYALGESI